MASKLQTWSGPHGSEPNRPDTSQDYAPSPDGEDPASASAEIADLDAAKQETRLALVNAVKLSLSMFGTLIVAVAVRFWLPKHVGPAAFGQINFADAFAQSFFVFSTFGVESYIRKEVSTRLDHVNDFFAGFVLVRTAATAIIIGLMCAALHWMDKGQLEWRLALIFAAGQIAYNMNVTLTASLHAAAQVNELAWMNVVSKILWGGGIVVGLMFGLPLEIVAVAFLVSEGIKAGFLAIVTSRKLNLRWSVDMRGTWAVLVASVPYFLNTMAHRTYEKLPVTMLSVMTNDSEVGWYGAAVGLAGFSLLFLPIMQAVVVPMAARTAAKSVEAMNELMRGVVRLVVVSGTLISLILMLHAHFVAEHAFGKAFGQSALSLQVLAPMFPLTYLAVLGAMHLIQHNRIWTMIKVSLFALVVNPLLNWPLITLGAKMGQGWAGGMSALASVCTEGLNAAITFALLGQAAVDNRFWKVLGKTLLICALVSLFHVSLAAYGAWLIPFETILYVGMAIAFGALPAADVRRMLVDARARRRKDSTSA